MYMQEYELNDLNRIFIGDVPPVFYLEIVIRSVLIYCILIAAIRLMGKKMALQLNGNELGAMVTLAAAIGIPLQASDRGILPAVIIVFVVILVQRGIALMIVRYQHFEAFSQGNLTILIENSVLNRNAMKSTGITPERLFEQLRAHGLAQTGEVRRFYLETSGAFTLVKQTPAAPGLSVIPASDNDFWKEDNRLTDTFSCTYCGFTVKNPASEETPCSNCGKHSWAHAVL